MRWYSLKMFPQEVEEWVSVSTASKKTGRAEKTINDWRRAGVIEFVKDDWGTLVEMGSVMAMCAIREENSKRGKTLESKTTGKFMII